MPAPSLKLGVDRRGQPLSYEIREQTTVFENFLKVERFNLKIQRFDGSWTTPFERHVATNASGLAIVALPYDPVEDKLIFVEQFRMGWMIRETNAWSLEAVAGLLEPNSTAEETVYREVLEETGLTPSTLKDMGSFIPSGGSLTEKLFCYIVKVAAPLHGSEHGLATEHENIRLHVLPADEAIRLLDSGQINDLKTAYMLQWFARHKEALRREWLQK